MTDREALRTIFDFARENMESISPIEAFHIGEAVGTLSRMVDERCREIILNDWNGSVEPDSSDYIGTQHL